MRESQLPPEFSASRGGGGLPLRHLDGFSIHLLGDERQLVQLEHLQGVQPRAVASGVVLQAGDAGGKRVELTTGPIHDWCLDLGESPGVWLVTDAAWYHLGAPARSYAAAFGPMARRLDLSLRALRVLRQDPAVSAEAAQERVLSGAVPGTSGHRYSLNALDAEAGFLARRLAALHEAGAITQPPGPLPPFVAALRTAAAQVERAQALVAAPPDLPPPPKPSKKRKPLPEEIEDDDEDAPPSVLRCLGLPAGMVDLITRLRREIIHMLPRADASLASSAIALPDDDVDDEFEACCIPELEARLAAERLGPFEREALRYELRIARDAERRAARRTAETREREAREAALDARRGPPPEPARAFRAPAAVLPDLMELWGLLSTFASAMEVPPFTFESLEAALCPGPFEGGRTPYEAALAGADGDAPMAEANGGAAGAAGAGPDAADGPLDPAGAAAGLLLRDVHLALLRCLEATLNKPGAKAPPQPLTARYSVRTGHGIVVSQQHWSQRAAATVHSFIHEVTDADRALAAAMELYQHDYSHLKLTHRVALLRGLAELALASEALREHVGARMDAPVAALKAARPRLKPGDSSAFVGKPWNPNSKKGRQACGGGPNMDADALDNEAAARGTDHAAVSAWIEWCDAHAQPRPRLELQHRLPCLLNPRP